MIISHNDEWLATCSDDKSVKVWDIEDRRLSYSYDGAHSSGIYGLFMTPDARYIVSGGEDGAIKIWNSDIATQKQERADVAHSKNKY
jgi:WD40 repeat protein